MAALAGALMLGERLSWLGWGGCGLIFLAILLVEAAAVLFSRGKWIKTVS